MNDLDLPEGHRSGFVVVVGRPNVGKSTLLNAFLGQPVAAVSPKPQTTRQNQLAILTLPEAQAIFVDTPGIHRPIHKLGETMDRAATEPIDDADVVLALFDLSAQPDEDDQRVSDRLRSLQPEAPLVVGLNKVDALSKDQVPPRILSFQELLPEADVYIPFSAIQGENRQELLEAILQRLPEGPRYYPEEELTDKYEREIASDLIRAAAMQLLHHEVPHSISVRVDEFKERNDHGAYVAATLFVERESQKGIVIGKGGSMIRDIGSLARQWIEHMSGRKLYLELRVKVLPGWRNDEKALKQLGFALPDG